MAKRKPEPDEAKKTQKVEQHLCAFNANGTPCHEPGTMSEGLHGRGPWFCRPHFALIMGWASTSTKVDDLSAEAAAARQEVLGLVRNMVYRKPSRDWARRISDRVAAAAPVPMVSEQFAREALAGRVPVTQEEPGAAG